MEIRTKVTTTYQLEVSLREVKYLRDMTRNHLAPNGEEEDKMDMDTRHDIFEACNVMLHTPTVRSNLS